MTGVTMKTTIVDVNGMEETVVVKMLTHNGVQLVNVWILMLEPQENKPSMNQFQITEK